MNEILTVGRLIMKAPYYDDGDFCWEREFSCQVMVCAY